MDTFPQYEGIQTNLFHLIDPTEMQYYLNDKSLAPLRKVPVCIAAAVYRISAGNCMPYTGNTNNDQKYLPFNAYQRNESPWEYFRQRSKKLEDTSSCSTLESTCSSRSDSPELKHAHTYSKKKSKQMLLREIRRLRGENAFLRSSVSVLKNDLRDCHLSRQNADIIHQRTFQEYESRHKSLEQEIVSKCDQVESLKEQVEQLKLAAYSTKPQQNQINDNNDEDGYIKRKSINNFGCYEFEQDDEGMACQPMAQESALPEVNIKMDEFKTDEQIVNDYFKRRSQDEQQQQEEEDEEEEEEEINDAELKQFQFAASSYIHQAIIAKLSSARVRLDFDDLIVKYEPSNDTIMLVLGNAFIDWVYSTLLKNEQSISILKIFQCHIQTGIDYFWKSILQCYAVDYNCQLSLLNSIEDYVKKMNYSILLDRFDLIIISLFKYDVLEEEALLTWHTNPVNDEQSRNIRFRSNDFIEYIQESDEEEDDDNDDDDNDDDDEDDDDDDNDDDDVEEDTEGVEYEYDDDSISFEFIDSPIPENDIDFAFENDKENSHDGIEDLLSVKERNPCICQFNYDNDTTESPLSSVPSSPTSGNHRHELPECSCDSTYSTPTTEKKKKSVRIAM